MLWQSLLLLPTNSWFAACRFRRWLHRRAIPASTHQLWEPRYLDHRQQRSPQDRGCRRPGDADCGERGVILV